MLLFKHQSAMHEILANLAESNPDMADILTPENFTLVNIKDLGKANNPNTEVTLMAKATTGYQGTITYTYNRIGIRRAFYEPIQVQGAITIRLQGIPGERKTLIDLNYRLSQAMGANFTVDDGFNGGDLTNTTITIPNYGETVTMSMRGNNETGSGSLGSLRNFDTSAFIISWLNEGREISDVVSVRDLKGMEYDDGTVKSVWEGNIQDKGFPQDRQDSFLMSWGSDLSSILNPVAEFNFELIRTSGSQKIWGWTEEAWVIIQDYFTNVLNLDPPASRELQMTTHASGGSWSYIKDFLVRPWTVGRNPIGTHWVSVNYGDGNYNNGYIWLNWSPSIV